MKRRIIFDTYAWTFSAIKSMRSRCGLVINIILATFVGGSWPPHSGYILTTSFSSSKLYLATRPVGPASDWSHTMAFYAIQYTWNNMRSFCDIEYRVKLFTTIENCQTIPSFRRIFPINRATSFALVPELNLYLFDHQTNGMTTLLKTCLKKVLSTIYIDIPS